MAFDIAHFSDASLGLAQGGSPLGHPDPWLHLTWRFLETVVCYICRGVHRIQITIGILMVIIVSVILVAAVAVVVNNTRGKNEENPKLVNFSVPRYLPHSLKLPCGWLSKLSSLLGPSSNTAPII